MAKPDYIAAFRQSYAEVQEFCKTWLPTIEPRCQTDPQRKAAFYAWSRFSMSIRTLERLLDPALLPDVNVICRGCIEFNVTLAAVMKNEKMAEDYLDFGKHAKANYIRLVAKLGDIDGHVKLRADFDENYEEDIDELRLTSWCQRYGGITGLMKLLDLKYDLRLYNMLCHFAHGSVAAMQTLDGKVDDPNDALARAITAMYHSYLLATSRFLDFVWSGLMTPDSERCKNGFSRIMENYAAHTR